jgi:hypothetical protein
MQALVGPFMVENGFHKYQEAQNFPAANLCALPWAEQRIKQNQSRMMGSA